MPQQQTQMAATHRQHQLPNLPQMPQQIASTSISSASTILPQQQQKPQIQTNLNLNLQQASHVPPKQKVHVTPPSVSTQQQVATAPVEKTPTRQYESALKAAERQAAVRYNLF